MEKVCSDKIAGHVFRIKVPGGWIIVVEKNLHNAVTFYPDAQHQWEIK